MTQPGPVPPLPGAVGLSRLRVYDTPAPDGLHGGSAHVHLLCTEGYVVLGGHGAVHTLGPEGSAEVELSPGKVVWFTPGTIHRLVNRDRELEILVVMQNSGLPEAGDCVLTFPEPVLADRDAYRRASSLAVDDRVYATDADAARRRRDLAVDGFADLRARFDAEGPQALEEFYRQACRLVSPRAESMRAHWERTALATAQETGERLRQLQAGRVDHLRGAVVQQLPSPADRHMGVCGTLGLYPADSAQPTQGGPR